MTDDKNNGGQTPEKPSTPQFPVDRVELSITPDPPPFPTDRIEKGEVPPDNTRSTGGEE